MAAKKITIVFVPDGSRKIRQLKIPKILLIFFLLISLCVAAFLTWAVRDYQAIRTKIPRLALLENENKEQEVQLLALTQKIRRIGRKLVELKRFDHKIRVMVNLDTNDDNTEFLGIGGSDPELLDPKGAVEKAHQTLVRKMHQSLSTLDTEISIQTNEKAELLKFLESQKSMLSRTPSIWPARGWVTSRFGTRISPFTNQKEFHRGLDISTRMGSPIVAPADGVVSSVGGDHAIGNMVYIDHGYGLKTKYGHLSKILVKKGQFVKRGQRIALVGNSGRTTGPHLHYEVHLNGLPVNPFRYILN